MQRVVGKMRLKAVSGIVLTVLLIGMVTLAFNVARAQPPETEWTRTYGGAGGDVAYSVVETSDGGYAIGGCGFANLVKTDAYGNQQWNKSYGGAVYCGVETLDGGYALAGEGGNNDFLLVKTYANGTMQWNQTYEGANMDVAYSVVETSDGGYALAGYTSSFGAGMADFWLVKVDSAGNHEWNQKYGGAGWDEALSVVETSDGGYALAGTTHSFGADSEDFWLVKVAGPPVGGIYIPVDKFGLLAQYIGLASTIILATVATAVFVKHKKKKQ